MSKIQKLTASQKRAKKQAKAERQKKYEWIFIRGKQVRVRKPDTIEGMDPDEYILRNADPIWLHQNQMWEYSDTEQNEKQSMEIIWPID